MPDFFSFHYVNYVMEMTPQFFILVFKVAVKNSKQRIVTGKTPATGGVRYYIGIKIKQEINWVTKLCLIKDLVGGNRRTVVFGLLTQGPILLAAFIVEDLPVI